MDPTDDVHALLAYTLGRSDAAFVHQHAVDALAAQTADAATPPQRLAFALAGLYLRVERGRSGREVQRVHAALARRRPTDWPACALPASRGALTVRDVMAEPAGARRDAAIDAWCASVWAAYAPCRTAVVAFVQRHGAEDRGGS